MKPKKLHLRNFGSHIDSVISFDQLGDSVVLTGPTGAGKSTVIDGMLYSLTGECRTSLDEQIRTGAIDMSVEFEFHHGQSVYRITRSRSRKGRGSSLVAFFEQREDRWVPLAEGKHAQSAIEERTRHGNYDLLTSTNFALQEKAGRLLEVRPADRLAATRTLLGVEDFSTWGKTCTTLQRAAGQRRDELVPDHERAREEVRKAEEAGVQIATAEVARRELEAQEARHAEELAAAEADLARARERVKERALLAQALEDAKRDEVEARAAVARARVRFEQVERQASEIPEAQRQVDALGFSRSAEAEARDELAAARSALEVAEKRVRTHEVAVRTALQAEHEARFAADREVEAVRAARRSEYDRLVMSYKETRTEQRARLDAWQHAEDARLAKVASAMHSIGNARQRMVLLNQVPCRGEGAFGSCGLIADARRARDQLPALEEELAAAGAPALQPEDGGTLVDLERRGAAAKAALDAPVPLNGAHSRLEAARAAMVALGPGPDIEAERQAVRAAQQKVDRLRDEVDALSSWPGRLANLRQAVGELEALERDLHAAEASLARASARVASASVALAALADEAIDALAGRASSLRGALQSIRERASVSAARVAQLRADFARLDCARAALEQLQGELDQKNLEVKRLATLVEVYKEIPVLLFEAAMPAVTDEANAMLTDLQAPERVRVECEKASKDGESVKDDMVIWVSDRRGYEREYATYSGGEKFSLAIALRKAFGELQSVRAVGASDAPILVVDEGWGSLDPERIKSFATVLRRVIQSKRFSLVLVVSHVQDVIDAFETKLLVSQDAEGSTVQVIR